MGLSDFSLSYTIEFNALWTTAQSGVFGSPAQLDVSELVFDTYGGPGIFDVSELGIDTYGALAQFEVSDIVALGNYAANHFPDVDGIGVVIDLGAIGSLIYYGDEGNLFADTVDLVGETSILTQGDEINFTIQAQVVDIIAQASSGVIRRDYSGAVITNGGAGGPVKTSLPANALFGSTYTIFKSENQDLNVDVEDVLDLIVSVSGNLSEISLDSIGSKATFIKVAENTWFESYRQGVTVESNYSLTPTQVDGLAAWWDASDSGTITIEPSNRVSQWNDKSGNGRHLAQLVDTDRPTVDSGNLNSLDGISFNGDHMTVSDPIFGQLATGPWTLIIIFEPDSAGSNQYLITFGDVESNNNYKSMRVDNNAVRLTYQDSAGLNTFNSSAGTTTDVALKVQWTDTRNDLRNLLVNDTTSNDGTDSRSPQGLDVFGIGRLERAAPFGNATATVYEVIAISGILNARESAGLANYLSDKWGI